MLDMRLDHLSYAAAPDGLAATARRIGGLLGKDFTDGGIHPRFGTRNMILPLADSTYLEIVEVLDHPASDKAPFGQAVRARSALGGGWLGWVVSVDDITEVERAARPRGGRRQPAPPRRHRAEVAADRRQRPDLRPAAAVLRAVGVPAGAHHPSAGGTGDFSLACLEIAGDPQRVSEWLGQTVEAPARGRQGRLGRPPRHPRHHRREVPDAERARPALSVTSPVIQPYPRISRGKRKKREVAWPPRRRCRARTSGTTPRRTSWRTAPPIPTAPSRRRCARGRTWAGRTFLDLGCGTGFHLPRWAAEAAEVIGVEPHADLVAMARRRTRRLDHVDVRQGTAQRIPLPDASVDVVQVRWAYFFGPGCEPGLAELDRVVRRGGTAFVIDNDATRSTFGGWFRRGYPTSTPTRSSGSGPATAGGVRRSTSAGRSRTGRTSRRWCASSSTRPPPTRCWPEHEGTEVDYAVNLWSKDF